MRSKELSGNWWKWEIKPKERFFKLGLRELYYNRGLILRFVRRDMLASYQQTLLGPLWIVLQPLFTTLVYIVIFSRFAKISTNGMLPVLFYLPGSIMWNFFSDCLNGTMYTFIANASVFNKVYFPRLVVPLSNAITQAIRLSIQCLLFILAYFFYNIRYDIPEPSIPILLLVPYLVLLNAAFALGTGLIISVFTAKYRDLDTFFQFFLRLFMFATPVVYPSSLVPEEYRFWFWLNPLTPAIEIFRAAFEPGTEVEYKFLFITSVEVLIIFIIGLLLFKKRELKVMDTI